MSRPTPLDLLVRGHHLIRDPRHWTQGMSAATIRGRGVPTEDSSAVCFCARGAVARAQFELGAGSDAANVASRILDQESRRLFGYGVISVNDGRRGEATQSRSGSHRRVVMVYEEVITAARAQYGGEAAP